MKRGEIYYCHERGEDGTEELLHEVHLGGGERGEIYITVTNGVKMGLKSSSTRYTWGGGREGRDILLS